MALLDLAASKAIFNSTNMSYCNWVSGDSKGGANPYAHNEGYDGGTMTVDSTGSIGNEVRVVITRDGVVIETTNGEANNGDNQITYTTPLQNGDIVCVHASFDGFQTYSSDCKVIPTPGFGFVPVT